MRAFQGLLIIVTLSLPLAARAQPSGETCGDGVDNDSDGLADEGCWPAGVTGVCESPLSCGQTGHVSPSKGQLVYPEPADLAPKVPYGPALTFQRTYFSQYAPGYNSPNATDFKAPVGFGWQHNFMSWAELDTAPNPDEIVLHTTTGQDVLFTYDSSSGGKDYYVPQPGYHFQQLEHKGGGAGYIKLTTLTGWVYEYDWDNGNSRGKLVKIIDSVGNELVITYNGDGQVSTVKDASGNRGFEFLYFGTGAKLLQYVELRSYDGGSSTLHTTLEMVYSGYKNTKVRIKSGDTIRDYTYDSDDKLATVDDGAGADLAAFYYLDATAGKVARIETPAGVVGYAYDVDCNVDASSDELQVFFHRANTSTCHNDTICGGEYCGGETDPGNPTYSGACFRSYRCIETDSPNEDLITEVTSSCTGCSDVAEYVWDTNSPTNDQIDLQATKTPRSVSAPWTTYEYNSDGLVTKMIEADDNNSPTSGPSGARITYYSYDSNFPGRIKEIRRLSELKPSGTCTASNATDCKITSYTYNATTGLMTQMQEKGFTYIDNAGSIEVGAYTYTTSYSYDSQGRLTQMSGPVSGNQTDFTYWSSTDVLTDGHLKEIKRLVTGTTYLVTTFDEYDAWGNAESRQDPDGTYTCFTYDGDRNVMTVQREAMNGQTSCTTSHSSDLDTTYTYDAGLRLTKLERPKGDCTHYAYDGDGWA